MSSKGIIYEITSGGDAGKFGLALNEDQHQEFRTYRKVFVHLYQDRELRFPVIDKFKQKKVVGLYGIERLKQIGFQD